LLSVTATAFLKVNLKILDVQDDEENVPVREKLSSGSDY